MPDAVIVTLDPDTEVRRKRVNEFSIVYLAWAPLGPGPVRSFLDSYARCPPGRAHDLTILLNGIEGNDARRAIEGELGDTEHHSLATPEPQIDLAAYRWALDRIETRKVVFLNSYSRPMIGGWLDLLDCALSEDGVGMVGATGTFESIGAKQFNWRTPWTKLFPGFPNPHLRTTGFMLETELARSIGWRAPKQKISALKLESGKGGISNEVKRRGLELRVVGRDGRSFTEVEWRDSQTYRSGEQENLLIADNRTDDFLAASPEQREQLSRLAWG